MTQRVPPLLTAGAVIGGALVWLLLRGGPTSADLARLKQRAEQAEIEAGFADSRYRAMRDLYESVEPSVRIVEKRVAVPVPGTPLPPETVYVQGDTTAHVVPGELPNRIRACEATLNSCEVLRIALTASRDIERDRANKSEQWGRKQRGKGRLEGALVTGGVVGILALVASLVGGR